MPRKVYRKNKDPENGWPYLADIDGINWGWKNSLESGRQCDEPSDWLKSIKDSKVSLEQMKELNELRNSDESMNWGDKTKIKENQTPWFRYLDY